VLVKAIEDVALGLASVYRQLELPLPSACPTRATRPRGLSPTSGQDPAVRLVIDEETADGREPRQPRLVCSSWGAVAGTLALLRGPFGVPRASI